LKNLLKKKTDQTQHLNHHGQQITTNKEKLRDRFTTQRKSCKKEQQRNEKEEKKYVHLQLTKTPSISTNKHNVQSQAKPKDPIL
jgi:hypothetical protein